VPDGAAGRLSKKNGAPEVKKIALFIGVLVVTAVTLVPTAANASEPTATVTTTEAPVRGHSTAWD
jgi:hypothetical protein